MSSFYSATLFWLSNQHWLISSQFLLYSALTTSCTVFYSVLHWVRLACFSRFSHFFLSFPQSSKGDYVGDINSFLSFFSVSVGKIFTQVHSCFPTHPSTLFILILQQERSVVCLAVFMDKRSGKQTDLAKEYAATDKALNNVKWRKFGSEKIFENKLRFQIRIDDFRYCIHLLCLQNASYFVLSIFKKLCFLGNVSL